MVIQAVEQLKRLVRIKFLRNMLLIAATAIFTLVLINILFIYPAFTQIIIDATEDEAGKLAAHLQDEHITNKGDLDAANFDDAFDKRTAKLLQAFHLIKIKIFSAPGETLYSTDSADIGKLNEHDYFHEVVAGGDRYTQVVRKNARTAEGQLVTQDVVETYIPIMENGDFIGAFELYYDITDTLNRLDTLNFHSILALILIGGSLFTVVFMVSGRMLDNEEHVRQLSQAVEQNSTGIIIVHLNGVVRYANEKVAQLNGYALTEIIGQPLADYLTYDQASSRAILEAVTAGANWKGECRSKTKTHDWRWEAVSVSPITDASGNVTHVLVTREDISTRKRAEMAVQQQKQYFEALVNNSPIAIVALDENGRINACNPAFEQLFGYSSQEVAGQDLDTLVIPEDLLEEATDYTHQVNEGHVVRITTKRRRRDGSLVDVQVFGVPVIVNDKEVGILALYHDITDHIESQAALEKAKNAAEAANLTKSEFLANMSHEIRTPLNGVIGMTGLLLDTPLTNEQRDFTQTIRSSGDALLTIINDILDFSKIEAGKLDLEEQPFHLRTCVEEALDLLAPKASNKGLELAYIIDKKIPAMVIGDVTRLRQILVNLIGNAVKFTAQGEVVVSIIGQVLDDNEYRLYLAVKDTGIGIPPERMDRLFKSFSQVDASTTRKFGGTGLGLVISKRLAEMMGGTMWVDSVVGEGSTFHFSIRVTAVFNHQQSSIEKDSSKLAGKRLLIVDDNETNRFILERQAQSWEMTTRSTEFGSEALNWLKSGEKFDIIVTDMHMPEMDGLTLAAHIHRIPGYQKTPLIMLTSLGQQVSDSRHTLLDAYLTKPVKPVQLHDTLITVLDKNTRKQAAVATAVSSQFDVQMGKRHPLCILLAEDNLINQKVALRMLERLGYRADVAANGLEVLEALRRQPYDVIFMDVQMPEMDGVETSQQIRQEWSPDQQPQIIAMTAHALKGDREFYMSVGMDNYVSKPVRILELIEALTQCHALGLRTGS